MLFAAILAVIMQSAAVSAASVDDQVPYRSYSYWQDGYENTVVLNKAMYKVKDVISSESLNTSAFTQLSDMCVGPDGSIYLIDTDAGELTVISAEHKVLSRVSTFKYGGKDLTLTKPRGVFVSEKNEVYVCDTEAERILVGDIYGNVNRILTVPDSTLLPEGFMYRPLKIAVDGKGYTYVLSDGSYYGALFYNPSGEFVGFYGANSVENSIATVLKNLWNKLTMTNEKRSGQVKSLPYQFTDLYIDSGGFVYTATGVVNSGSKAGTIRRLSPGGTNILNSNDVKFGESDEARKSSGEVITQDISGLCVDENDFIYAFDRGLGNIYMYDTGCNFITAFGGGVKAGTQDGVFQLPCAIDTYNGDIYVCDANNLTVTVFEPTEYGKLVKQAQKYTIDGDYDSAKPLWREILKLDKNCRYAYVGLGKAALAENDYENALIYSRKGLDREVYSGAYEKVRGDWLNKNFSWIFVLAVAVFGGAVAALVYKKKKGIVLIKNRKAQLAATAVFRPSSVFGEISEKKNGSVTAAVLITVLFYISEIVKNDFYGFAFSSDDVSAFNSVIVLVRSVGAVCIWTVSNWAVCTLFGGRGKLKDIFIVTCYSLTVLIISNILTTVLSNFMLPGEAAVLSLITTIAWIYTAVVLTVGLITVHDFSFGKFVGTALLSALGLLLIVFLIAATVILVQQILAFAATLFYELSFR